MKKPSSRRNILKDAAIVLVLAALLLALPWSRDILRSGNDYEEVPEEQSQEGNLEPNENFALEARQRAFIDEVFPQVSSWQVASLEPYLASATMTGNWSAEIGSVLGILSDRLGHLERYSEPEAIDSVASLTSAQGDRLSTYEFVANYENGMADIDLVLSDDAGEAKLHSFSITVRDEDAPL